VPSSFSDSFASIDAYVAWLGERLSATIPTLKASAIVAIHCDFHTSHHVRLLLDRVFTPEHFVNHLIWHYGLGGSSPRRFARKHDDILVYCVDPALYYFDPPMVPATSNRLKGKLKKATDVLGGMPGVPECPGDSLLDVASLNNMSNERTGYPTQKPLALLELLVRAFCPVGGMVLDPTCGSGTTLVAAARAGREAIGFDLNPGAVAIARGRLG
jgi:DNA modification methylase